MRKVDCLYKLDTPVACARRHQQDDNEVRILARPGFSAVYCGHTVRHYTRASHGLVDMKLRNQIICNPRFKREIKLARF